MATLTPTAATKTQMPIDLMKWIEQHKHEMKPPVSNKYLYDGEDFFVMIIQGPNSRKDLIDGESRRIQKQTRLGADEFTRFVDDELLAEKIRLVG